MAQLVLNVTCYVSHVTCHLSPVTYHLSLIPTAKDPQHADSPIMHCRLVDMFLLLAFFSFQNQTPLFSSYQFLYSSLNIRLQAQVVRNILHIPYCLPPAKTDTMSQDWHCNTFVKVIRKSEVRRFLQWSLANYQYVFFPPYLWYSLKRASRNLWFRPNSILQKKIENPYFSTELASKPVQSRGL